MDLQLRQYRKNLSKPHEENRFLLPWASIVLRNCDDLGDLVSFKNYSDFKKSDRSLWVLLYLYLFRENGQLFSVYGCDICSMMKAVPGMKLDQSKEVMVSMQCVHSRVAAALYPDWEDHWTIDGVDDTDMSYRVVCNPDIKIQTLLQEQKFLAAIQSDGLVTLLFSIGTKQKFPICSRINCSNKTKCICYKKYKKILEEDDNDDIDDDDRPSYYWDKRKRKKATIVDHYMERLPVDEHHRQYGYNKTSFDYQIKRCSDMQQKFLRRMEGFFDLPEKIVPEPDESSTCCHGNLYSQDDDQLRQMSPNLVIHTETSDRIFDIPTYGRPTQGDCKCYQQADTHNLLLWNLGSGQLIDYLFLHNHFHKMVSSGTAMNATFNARKTALSSVGVQSSLIYSAFLRACNGYAQSIRLRKEDFLCPSCGDSPKYIVCDGKTEGPTKRKVNHLHELDAPEDDESPLPQGSRFEDRVFLFENRERKLVCNLLTDVITMEEFLQSDIVLSSNGQLVKNLIERISQTWPDEIPKPYKEILANISKNTSVAGYLQVLSNEPLNNLAEFCLQSLDIRAAENSEIQKEIGGEMPALWPNLVEILNLEHLDFLPGDLSSIILKLIEIRKNTFIHAAHRSPTDYIQWDNTETEHATQYYPNWPIFRHPKKYTVRNVTDCEFCCKSFNKHTDFSFGVFSVGCACPYNITYGYELMLCKESAHNIFRLLMCRDVDLCALQGVIFDFACGLDRYILNREPREFEFLRCLVDGSHWQGHKKMKKPDRSGAGGHSGCSTGYNYNLYKKYLPYKQPNSQGREQMHAKLDKLCPSLKQMNYVDFMNFLRVYFGLTNLINKGEI